MEICFICYCVFWDLNTRLLNFTRSVGHIYYVLNLQTSDEVYSLKIIWFQDILFMY